MRIELVAIRPNRFWSVVLTHCCRFKHLPTVQDSWEEEDDDENNGDDEQSEEATMVEKTKPRKSLQRKLDEREVNINSAASYQVKCKSNWPRHHSAQTQFHSQIETKQRWPRGKSTWSFSEYDTRRATGRTAAAREDPRGGTGCVRQRHGWRNNSHRSYAGNEQGGIKRAGRSYHQESQSIQALGRLSGIPWGIDVQH